MIMAMGVMITMIMGGGDTVSQEWRDQGCLSEGSEDQGMRRGRGDDATPFVDDDGNAVVTLRIIIVMMMMSPKSLYR